MFKKIFGKKTKENNELHIKQAKDVEKKKETQKTPNPKVQPSIVEKKLSKEDFDVQQSIEMGLDMKDEVRRFSRAFFNSKNSYKASCYLRFESFLGSLPFEKRRELQQMTYVLFKEKEHQFETILKNGFSQFLSKGANLNDETRGIIKIVFGDVKKLPSRGHRYWYYKIYMWQEREKESN